MKKILVYLTAAALALTVFGLNPAEAEAAPKSKGIEREGSSKRTVYVGKSFELEVEKGKKLRDNDLYWSVGNSKIVKIVDKDRTDDEIDLKAVKAGKTKVYCKNKVTGNKLSYTITVKKGSNKISRVGAKTRTISQGSEFELKVKLGGAISENKVKWTIGNTAIVGYDDDDRTDNEMEFYAKQPGTTKITAKNLLTGGTLSYTVKVKAPEEYSLARVGGSTITVEVGDDEEIGLTKGTLLSDDQIQWSIADPAIAAFVDGRTFGPEVDIAGLQVGTTKVYVKNLHTGGQLTYTVKVVPDYED